MSKSFKDEHPLGEFVRAAFFVGLVLSLLWVIRVDDMRISMHDKILLLRW